MSDKEELESALHQFEAAASSFAGRSIRMAQVRSEYVVRVREMSNSLRTAVEFGELSAQMGAEMAQQMRNQILAMQRSKDMDLGRSLAISMKSKGLRLQDVIAKAMKKMKLGDVPFRELSDLQQRQIYIEVINSAGRSRASVTSTIPKLRWAGRTLWLATFAVAAYNIGTAENPWWQTGREATTISGGLAGGFGGGAAAGALGGMWAGPVGVAIGVLVGGALGALLADHAYVETAGTSDSSNRSFMDQFTGFFTGTDEVGMAQTLASEHHTDPLFTMKVFQSLNSDYYTDSDDIALQYIKAVRKNIKLQQALIRNNNLRELLIQVLEDGWTSAEEQKAIWYLQSLPYGRS